jgi:DNA invertase Pin-like site-specific DNA recombinase
MKPGAAKHVRCAIYTRVSTDQGLEQDFNSLDAQYDACQSYIRSQAHAGWTLLRVKYDDGGFSGGTALPCKRCLRTCEPARSTGHCRLQSRSLDPIARGLCQTGRAL